MARIKMGFGAASMVKPNRLLSNMKLKIYIVEDSPIIAASLIQMVTTMGHDVAGLASSYDEAVAKLNKIDVDMVITDIMLNGQKTGVELGAYIKQYLNIPFIYQSSIADECLKQQALLTEPLAYVNKPMGRVDLANALLSVEAA